MFDREKNLFDSYAAKRISRRDLLGRRRQARHRGRSRQRRLRILGLAGDGRGFQLEGPERQVRSSCC